MSSFFCLVLHFSEVVLMRYSIGRVLKLVDVPFCPEVGIKFFKDFSQYHILRIPSATLLGIPSDLHKKFGSMFLLEFFAIYSQSTGFGLH